MDIQLPIQSAPITTKVVRSNLTHGKVHSIQQFKIKFVSDLRQVSGFLLVLQFRPQIKLITTINRKIVESGIKHHNPNPYLEMSAEYLGMNNIFSPMNDTGTNTTTVQTKGKTNDYKHV